MAAWGYEFYLPVLEVSLTSERNPLFLINCFDKCNLPHSLR